MAEADELHVYLNFGKKRLSVGRLTFIKSENRTFFEYSREFISSYLEISPQQLPLGTQTFRAPRITGPDDPLHGLHGVFADSLPDRWGLKVQDIHFKRIGIDNPSALDRLAFVGQFGIGALQYEPAMRINDYGKNIVEISTLRKSAIGIIEGSADKISDKLLKHGGSAGGMRPKFLVNMHPDKNTFSYGIEPLSGEIPCIIKVPVEKTEDYQRIEYSYSVLAKKAGIKIPDTYLIESKGQFYFAIQRFDVNTGGSRFHTHTLAGLMGIDFGTKSIDYRDAMKLTLALTKDKREIAELYRRMVFNIMGHNCDDHAKNLSFLMDEDGVWKLSPAYDMSYSRSRDDVHEMSTNGKTYNHTKEDFRVIAREFNIKEWKNILLDVGAALKKWPQTAEKANVPADRIESVGKAINRHIQEIF
jgi:serine/threonine-protein kinase HipA